MKKMFEELNGEKRDMLAEKEKLQSEYDAMTDEVMKPYHLMKIRKIE